MPRKKRRGKVTKRVRVRVRRRGRRVAAPVGMAAVLASLNHARTHLAAQRAGLDDQIAALDRALSAMGSAPQRRAAVVRAGRGRGRLRGRRAGSLKDYIARVLAAKKGTMAVKDVTAAVRSAGYATKNKTLAKSIGIALTQMPDVRKVGRGLFRLK